MDIEKLIERLNNRASRPRLKVPGEAFTSTGVYTKDTLDKEAADALEQLQAENEKLREKIEDARLEGYAKGLGEIIEENEKLRAELEQVKRDRDSIEQDFRAFTKQWWEEDNGFPCRWCKFERQGGCEWKVKHPGEICAGRAFEWFGQKED